MGGRRKTKTSVLPENQIIAGVTTREGIIPGPPGNKDRGGRETVIGDRGRRKKQITKNGLSVDKVRL